MNFEEAVIRVKQLKESPDNGELLALYGYYKQATVGDCNIAEPSFWQLKEKEKWKAWNSHKESSQDTAKAEYIKLVQAAIIKYGTQ